MKNLNTKRLVNAALSAVIAFLITQLLGVVKTFLFHMFGAMVVVIVNVFLSFGVDLAGFLLAYLITTAAICKEKAVMKKGLIGALCCMGISLVVGFVIGLVTGLFPGLYGLPLFNIITGVLNFAGGFLAAYLAGFVCFREPAVIAPYGAPQGNYGMPQAPYGAPQGNYGMPQPPYGAPQGNYGMPQTPYGAPQGDYNMPQTPYAAPQVPYGAPQAPQAAPEAPAEPGAENA